MLLSLETLYTRIICGKLLGQLFPLKLNQTKSQIKPTYF